MTRLRVVLCLMLGLIAFAVCARAQEPARPDNLPGSPPAETAVVIGPKARAQLAARWDDHTAAQAERGFCLAVTIEHIREYVVYRATDAVFVPTIGNPYASVFTCRGTFPHAQLVVDGHTHPPATCDPDAHGVPVTSTCVLGGDAAWDCTPSPADMDMVTRRGAPFHVLQCDRNAIITIWKPKRNDP